MTSKTLLHWMRKQDVPVSRDAYLQLAYGNDLPDPWTPEHEAELPDELQDFTGDSDAQESGEPSVAYVGHPGEGYTAAARIDTDGVIKTTEASDVATAIFEKRAVKYYARQISDVADFSWEPDKHPRGQPENKGQFGPGGGGAEPIPRAREADAREH